MIIAALLSCVIAAGPGPDELVAALEDDSIERREQAAADLLALGPEALPELRAALDTASDPESRARLGDLVHRLGAGKRQREFQGGEIQGGFRAALRKVDSDPSTLRIEIEIRNVGEGVATFVPVRMWNLLLPWERFGSNLSEGTLTIRQRSGDSCGQPATGRLCVPGPNRRTSVLLQPGESRIYECRLDLESVPRGEYLIEFEYSSSWLLRSAENLKSNPLTFTVDR